MSVIVDAVTHAFDSRSSNAKAGAFAQRALDSFFAFQWDFLPDPYRLESELYYRAIDADTFVSAMFLESTTDVAVYHTIPAWGVFGDLSPIEVICAVPLLVLTVLLGVFPQPAIAIIEPSLQQVLRLATDPGFQVAFK